jgi:hypothetical protein
MSGSRPDWFDRNYNCARYRWMEHLMRLRVAQDAVAVTSVRVPVVLSHGQSVYCQGFLVCPWPYVTDATYSQYYHARDFNVSINL